jgi:hypothetical protein
MAATTGHSINTGPYRENTEISSSRKLLHWLNLNYASIIGRSFTNFVFYVDRNSKMTTTAGHSFYIGPIGFFYNQVNDTGSWEPLVRFFRRDAAIWVDTINKIQKRNNKLYIMEESSHTWLIYTCRMCKVCLCISFFARLFHV